MMVDSRWYFGLAGLLFIGLLARLLHQHPGDAEQAWRRQERLYRQRGLLTQRPDNWEQIYRRSRIAVVLFLVMLASIVTWFITRVYAL
jgi:hypothetical protein